VALDAHRIASDANRPVSTLTRRDVARALLAAGPADALPAMPAIRRELISAGNPMSAVFWDSAAATMQRIADDAATVGEVQNWLETTGTEPASMIGMLVWDEQDERSSLQAEIYGLLVAHLEELVAAGRIDPDELATGGPAALEDHRRLQEQWMMAPQPGGRVPMWTVLDEADEELLAEWDAAEAEALDELRGVLAELPARPVPESELRAAARRVREVIGQSGWPRDLLVACGGLDPGALPRDDRELWLTVAAGVVSPVAEVGTADDQDEFDLDDDDDLDDEDDLDGVDAELTDDEQTLVALCALDHYDWLAVATALARGGPGTDASPEALARYVAEYDPDDFDDQADAAAGMFMHAMGLWDVLGIVDDERLTALGWWGVPEAVQRAWEPRSDH
jgi:hypothetical protein